MVLMSPTIVFGLAFDPAGNVYGTGGFPATAFGGTEGSAIRWDGRGSCRLDAFEEGYASKPSAASSGSGPRQVRMIVM